ncbi:spore coat protein F precursor [Clostridium puniceum]|uniref:Spore coat protein F n=1 Tax=Clostridium puniceum TaxID=29367 RepID=A0A1S8SZ06_9CLOT|nr:spore coat protein [Clostridium puniceum]OOM70750.1 spore coat protein F precursor [Clostridium puniceum]
MINDYLEIRNAEGMPKLVGATMSLGFLLNAKSRVRNYAIALTEATNAEIRAVLRKQLKDVIATYEKISTYTMEKDYYHAYDIREQLKVDMLATETALKLI